jgi:hypothetical protein
VPRGAQPRRLNLGAPEPDDAQDGAWPRERLEAMDARFVAQLERAIERGEEPMPIFLFPSVSRRQSRSRLSSR